MSEKTKVNRGRPSILTDSVRKKRRKEVLSKYDKKRINIGKEQDRWINLKANLHLASHVEVAQFLLERYESTCNEIPVDRSYMTGVDRHLATTKPTDDDQGALYTATSTPAPSRFPVQLPPDVSDISSSEQGNKLIWEETVLPGKKSLKG